MDFVVTGLPRSRTAWLSVALTHGPVRCAHEALLWDKDRSARWAAHGGLVGNSDSGYLLNPIPEGAKLIVVRRDPAEALRSYLGLFKSEAHEAIRAAWPGLVEQVYKLDAVADLVVGWDHLDADTGLSIWKAIGADAGSFDRDRWTQLTGMNIQVELPSR